MKVVGYRKGPFKKKDGTYFNGFVVFCTNDNIKPDVGEGVSCESFFLSDYVSNSSNYLPTVGDEIELYYDRRGYLKRVEEK